MGNLSISPGRPGDARELAALRATVARGMAEEFGEGHWSACASKADVQRQLRASCVLVARRDSRIVGVVRLDTARSWSIGSLAFTAVTSARTLRGLAVAPEARGQKIGRELVEAAKEVARSRAVEALWLDAYDHVAGAGPFYEACGFRRVGCAQHRGLPLVYYEWLTTAE